MPNPFIVSMMSDTTTDQSLKQVLLEFTSHFGHKMTQDEIDLVLGLLHLDHMNYKDFENDIVNNEQMLKALGEDIMQHGRDNDAGTRQAIKKFLTFVHSVRQKRREQEKLKKQLEGTLWQLHDKGIKAIMYQSY